MYHYIGFIWNSRNADASRAATIFRTRLEGLSDWTRLITVPGLTVFDRQPRPPGLTCYVLPNEIGIILGRLFPRSFESWTPSWRATICESEANNILESRGRWLVDNYWGSYVAFLFDQRRNLRQAIRDCSGKIPCYRTQADGVEILFSDVGDLDGIGLPPFTINWRYISAFIYNSQLQIRETGITEVTELLAGDVLTMSNDERQQTALWGPKTLCTNCNIEDDGEAATRLRVTTQQCISSWASIYDSVLLSLSGGFDSAVVLACLSKAASRPTVTCVNRFGNEWAGDERSFARIAASKANVDLIEVPWSNGSECISDQLLRIPKVVKPHVPGIFEHLDLPVRNEIARQVAADTYWTGEGGDHIFFQMKSALGVGDYIQCHGLGRNLPKVIRDSARLSRISYWEALCRGMAQARSRTAFRPKWELEGGGGFLCPDVLSSQTIGYIENPWIEDATGFPTGKQYQIRLLSEVLNRERPAVGVEYAGAQHPLLSQPLLDLCLRIPIYLLTMDGRQRGLARDAFKRMVPPEIIWRETKGTTTMHTLRVFRRSRPFISELLLNGVLVREGILSRKALEPHVAHTQPIRVEQIFPLLSSITAEIWVRSWSNTTRPAAA